MRSKIDKFTIFSGNVTTDNMLKDLDVALRASRNYIESTNDEKMRSKASEGFSLERQVCCIFSDNKSHDQSVSNMRVCTTVQLNKTLVVCHSSTRLLTT